MDDPLAVLRRLLGSEDSKRDVSRSSKVNGADSKVDESDFDLDFGGLSLHELLFENTSDLEETLVYGAQTVDERMYKKSTISLQQDSDPRS